MSDHLIPEEITACRDGETHSPQADKHLRECRTCRGKLQESSRLAGILRRFAAQKVPETPPHLISMAREIMMRPQPARFLGAVIGRILGEDWLQLEFNPAMAGAMLMQDSCALSYSLECRLPKYSDTPLVIKAGGHLLALRGRPAPGGAVLEIEARDRRMAPAAGLRFSLQSSGRATVVVATDVDGFAAIAVLAGESALVVHGDVAGEISLRIG